jgi:pyruvate/2-oxoglutarate dehydrogenase complex dihydrolipoamide dehydrogenase (E3) component
MGRYDIILIGTGQATGTIMGPLQQMGMRVAVVEGGRFGGTCVNYGCSPTKTLVASARAAYVARRGPDFGVMTGDVEIDFAKVMARQNDLRNSWSSGMEDWLVNDDSIDVYKGYGVFTGPNSVRVGDDEIEGERIVIHTGARPRQINLPGLDEVSWMTNRDLLDLKELPEHLILVGGSYISLEFGQMFRRFGSQVTILEKSPQLMFREDEDVAEAARGIMEKEGVTVHTGVDVQRVGKSDGAAVTVYFEKDGQQHEVSGSHLMIAAGRVPNSEKLNLSAAGVEVNERGYIPVNDVTQTNVPHIYALGDVNGRGAFTHTSVHDGQVFVDHLQGGDMSISERIMTYAMYIDPPLGRVGIGEKQTRESDRNILMAVRNMSQISRAIEKDETDGLVKIFVDADSEEIVGATILGIGGDEIIGMFTAFMYTGASYKQFKRVMLNHPTVSELMPFILEDLKPLD